jgi:periplasmic protein TonB
MPHDLFGGALAQRPCRSTRRRSLTIFSVALHTVVVALVVMVQVFAVGPLPFPRRPMVFEEIRLVHLANIQIPRPRRSSGPQPALASHGLAPTVAPPTSTWAMSSSGITHETGLENLTRETLPGPAFGVADGIPDVGSTFPAPAVPPAPPLPSPQLPVHLHQGIEAPKKIADVTPTYPTIAQAAHVKGMVILEAVIDVHGNVTSVQVLRSVPLLDQAAVDAVRQWRYTPARLNGQPVPVVVTITINFSMQ